MRNSLIHISFLCLLFIVVSGCEEKLESPNVEFSIKMDGNAINEPYSVKVGDELTFSIKSSNLDKCSVWPGTNNRRYPDDYGSEGASGINLQEDEEDVFENTFAYDTTGTFTITIISSNWNYGGDEFKEVMLEKEITIN